MADARKDLNRNSDSATVESTAYFTIHRPDGSYLLLRFRVGRLDPDIVGGGVLWD